MANINIVASVDVDSILKNYKSEIVRHYGWDPTIDAPYRKIVTKLLAIDDNHLCKLKCTKSKILSDYVKLVTYNTNRIRQEITDGNTETINGKKYLNSNYNLTVLAKNGDTLTWWGQTINFANTPKVLVHNVVKSSEREHDDVSEFGTLNRNNVTFYYAGSLTNTNKVEHAAQSSYRLEGTLNGNIGQEVKYGLIMWLLSDAFMHKGSLITVPIVKLAVNCTVRIIG